MGKIISPGSLIVDLTCYAPRLPSAGETVVGTQFKLGPGGKGSNQMTAASRAGATVRMIGSWGKETLSAVLKEHYAREGMSTEFIRVSEKEATGVALIEVDEKNAQNRIIIAPGANAEVGYDEVMAAESAFASSDVALCQFETSLSAVEATAALAKKYRIPVILNPAPYVEAPDSLLDGIDYLTPNETETEAMTGVAVSSREDARRAAGILLEKGVRKVILTLGDRGSYYFDGEKEIVLPALPVKAADTTGAGDAFSGGLAAALSDGFDDGTALRFAACTASLSVTRKGSSASMPFRPEIAALMRSAYGIEIA